MEKIEFFFNLAQNSLLVGIGGIVLYLFFELSKRIPLLVDTLVTHIPTIARGVEGIQRFLDNKEKAINEYVEEFRDNHKTILSNQTSCKNCQNIILERLNK